jgi:ssDNA-binding replication factor A large subunit
MKQGEVVLIDVIGVITEVEAIGSITMKSNGEQKEKR